MEVNPHVGWKQPGLLNHSLFEPSIPEDLGEFLLHEFRYGIYLDQWSDSETVDGCGSRTRHFSGPHGNRRKLQPLGSVGATSGPQLAREIPWIAVLLS